MLKAETDGNTTATIHLDKQPLVFEDMEPFWDAFWELSSSRRVGMGAGGIPYDVVSDWLNEHRIGDYEERLKFRRWIRFIDAKYLARVNEKKDEKGKK